MVFGAEEKRFTMPEQSPDINPKENLWKILSNKIRHIKNKKLLFLCPIGHQKQR